MKKKISNRLQVSDFRTFNSLDLAASIRRKFPRMNMFMVDSSNDNIEYNSVSFIYATDMLERINVIILDKQLAKDIFDAAVEYDISIVSDDNGDCIRDYKREVFINRLNVIFHEWSEKNAVLKIAGLMK